MQIWDVAQMPVGQKQDRLPNVTVNKFLEHGQKVLVSHHPRQVCVVTPATVFPKRRWIKQAAKDLKVLYGMMTKIVRPGLVTVHVVIQLEGRVQMNTVRQIVSPSSVAPASGKDFIPIAKPLTAKQWVRVAQILFVRKKSKASVLV